jgi:hypothetical protein
MSLLEKQVYNQENKKSKRKTVWKCLSLALYTPSNSFYEASKTPMPKPDNDVEERKLQTTFAFPIRR